MNAQIVKMELKVQAAKKALKKVIRTVQKKCKHRKIAECDYTPSSMWSNAQEPMRICLDCGMSEIGWGCGHIVLKSKEVVKIDRDLLYSLREGLMIWEGDKGPLIRKEITVEEMVDNVTI